MGPCLNQNHPKDRFSSSVPLFCQAILIKNEKVLHPLSTVCLTREPKDIKEKAKEG